MATNSPNKIKDPDAKLDFGIDWSDWLAGGETIIASVWAVPPGITQSSSPAPSNTPTTTTIWLEGGTAKETYVVVNRITTSAGRIDERSLYIQVKNR